MERKVAGRDAKKEAITVACSGDKQISGQRFVAAVVVLCRSARKSSFSVGYSRVIHSSTAKAIGRMNAHQRENVGDKRRPFPPSCYQRYRPVPSRVANGRLSRRLDGLCWFPAPAQDLSWDFGDFVRWRGKCRETRKSKKGK